ncbi:c-type cytochrome [Sulfuriflexus mobilis]|uniref:c-type cytochrome n=1 Tax=Sulfuriflexus mobilis TaxID=1811807 RepID=UPI000F83FA8C|nr:c-type cytochrome [Sulfuriflexus mobilis]
MRSRIPTCSLLITALLLAATTTAQAVGISQGAMLANSCAACHGTDGRSPGAIPSIHGKSAEFISSALTEFRSGERASTVMGRHTRGYSDEEIRLIAEHFGTLK